MDSPSPKHKTRWVDRRLYHRGIVWSQDISQVVGPCDHCERAKVLWHYKGKGGAMRICSSCYALAEAVIFRRLEASYAPD